MASTQVNVHFIDDEVLEFSVQPNTTGQQFFDQVLATIGLREEVCYFGLQCADSNGDVTWLKLNKKVLRQDIKKDVDAFQFRFLAKYFPENASEEIIQNKALSLFFRQVENAILNIQIYCSPEECLILAGYALQAKYGSHRADFLSKSDNNPYHVPPERVQLTCSEWRSKISVLWQEHGVMMKEDAMRQYLKIAQTVQMYAVEYIEVKNKKGTELFLGVHQLGLNVYEKNDKLTPKVGFTWSEIREVRVNKKKLVIKPTEKQTPDFVFFAATSRINKRILDICTGNQELYVRRRKPEERNRRLEETIRRLEETNRRLEEKVHHMAERIENLEEKLERAYSRLNTLVSLTPTSESPSQMNNPGGQSHAEIASSLSSSVIIPDWLQHHMLATRLLHRYQKYGFYLHPPPPLHTRRRRRKRRTER